MDTQPITHISRDFVWDANPHRGYMGWRPANQPGFDAGQAYHVAHDMVEHLHQNDSSLEEEMRAFGVTLYLRGETGYWSEALPEFRKHDEWHVDRMTSEMLSSDMLGFLETDERLLSGPVEYANTMSPRAERQLRTVEQFSHTHNIRHPTGQNWRQRVEFATAWVRLGYAEAKARYQLDERRRLRMFNTIIKVVDDLMMSIQNTSNRPRTGNYMHVEVSPQSGCVNVSTMGQTMSGTF